MLNKQKVNQSVRPSVRHTVLVLHPWLVDTQAHQRAEAEAAASGKLKRIHLLFIAVGLWRRGGGGCGGRRDCCCCSDTQSELLRRKKKKKKK